MYSTHWTSFEYYKATFEQDNEIQELKRKFEKLACNLVQFLKITGRLKPSHYHQVDYSRTNDALPSRSNFLLKMPCQLSSLVDATSRLISNVHI